MMHSEFFRGIVGGLGILIFGAGVMLWLVAMFGSDEAIRYALKYCISFIGSITLVIGAFLIKKGLLE